jgi:MFS transporter, DHA2 family, multidrug resistance protein
MLSGAPMALLMPVTPLFIRHIDVRVAAAFGMLLLAISAFLETDLSPLSNGSAFAISQIMRGVGTTFTGMFLNQAAVRSVSREEAGDAAGVYNAARNLGGSLALASIAIIQDQRLWLHTRRLEESLRANSVMVQDYVAGQARELGGQSAALQALEGMIQTQALTMTYADLFWLLTVAIVMVTPSSCFCGPFRAASRDKDSRRNLAQIIPCS